MESEANSGPSPGLARWWAHTPQTAPSTDVMNQLCRVCGEPAAGFHFGAFTCEGCKSFFGRTYNNLGSITECKNNGECVINKKNRTACKACRLRKCLLVGMSKSGSRYGRRSNWFKIHCLLQEQQQVSGGKDKTGLALWGEGYKAMVGASGYRSHDGEDSKSEDNNNSNAKDRERSPPHQQMPPSSYSAEAAAIWAARNSFLPMQLPPNPMGVPFLPAPFSAMHGPQPPRFLLPFMHGLHPHSMSPSPSRSSRSSCSHSPSPGHQPPTSPLPLESHERLAPPANLAPPLSHPKAVEEQFLSVLRNLGPVQDHPMDLSVKETFSRHRRKNSSTRRVECADESTASSNTDLEDSASDSNDVDQKDENFNRRKTPLDLTKSIRVTS